MDLTLKLSSRVAHLKTFFGVGSDGLVGGTNQENKLCFRKGFGMADWQDTHTDLYQATPAPRKKVENSFPTSPRRNAILCVQALLVNLPRHILGFAIGP